LLISGGKMVDRRKILFINYKNSAFNQTKMFVRYFAIDVEGVRLKFTEKKEGLAPS
jgi:uncharacterized protein YfbU (UPF0304 family)